MAISKLLIVFLVASLLVLRLVEADQKVWVLFLIYSLIISSFRLIECCQVDFFLIVFEVEPSKIIQNNMAFDRWLMQVVNSNIQAASYPPGKNIGT
jgi:hypothetical protein